jgi:CheY-like chemotaxis protein
MPTHETNEPMTAQVPAASRRILIVDDNLDGAESLAMVLEEAGHTTHVAHDGVEAIAAAERVRPEAVLLDIGLPKLDGYEVCHRIRETSWGKPLLMVALTGWGQDEDRHRSRQAGFDAHLVKPVDFELLFKLLAARPAGSEARRDGANDAATDVPP